MAVTAHRSAGAVTAATEDPAAPEVTAAESSEVVAAETDASAGVPPDIGRGAPRWVYPATVALSVALVTLLVLAVVAGVRFARAQADDAARADAVAAAKEAIVDLTAFDFQTAEADLQRLTESTTPRFIEEFRQDRDAFLTLLRTGQVTTTSEVTEAGLAEYDDDTARVLVSVRSTLRNLTIREPEQRNYRVAMQMLHQDGRWLADRVEFIP